jgi:pyrroloquinoline quinone biosynthesis protein B
MADQLQQLDDMDGVDASPLNLSAIFITHAHIGHYAGLMFLGREAAGSRNVPVYAMPRLSDYLKTNGPWEQLVSLENILLKEMLQKEAVVLSDRLSVTPYRVPHRDEYSETVGYKIQTADKSALFIPDIDSWDEWESEFNIKIEEMISSVDFAFLDATFFSDQELPGRDMSKIPHPRVSTMMDRFDRLSASEKQKIQFIHFNHTNPIRFENSEESKEVTSRGYGIARRGNRHCLL